MVIRFTSAEQQSRAELHACRKLRVCYRVQRGWGFAPLDALARAKAQRARLSAAAAVMNASGWSANPILVARNAALV